LGFPRPVGDLLRKAPKRKRVEVRRVWKVIKPKCRSEACGGESRGKKVR
jgi:hypothetical protein